MPLGRYIACLLLAWLPAAHARAQAPSYVGEWSAPGEPWSITTGPDGNLWVSFYAANEVRTYAPDGTLLSTLSSGPYAFRSPLGVAFGPGGDIYVGDYFLVRIRHYSGDGTYRSFLDVSQGGDIDARGAGVAVISTGYPGPGTVYATTMTGSVRIFCNDPKEDCGTIQYNNLQKFRGIVADETDGTLYVADLAGGRIYHARPYGERFGDWPCGGGPNHIALDQVGRLWISRNANDIRVYTKDGTLLFSFGQTGTGPGQFSTPSGVAIGRDGNIYVADRLNNRVQVFGFVVPTRPSSWGRLKTTYRGSPGPVP